MEQGARIIPSPSIGNPRCDSSRSLSWTTGGSLSSVPPSLAIQHGGFRPRTRPLLAQNGTKSAPPAVFGMRTLLGRLGQAQQGAFWFSGEGFRASAMESATAGLKPIHW